MNLEEFSNNIHQAFDNTTRKLSLASEDGKYNLENLSIAFYDGVQAVLFELGITDSNGNFIDNKLIKL